MRFLSDILAKAGLIVDGAVIFNSTANGQTPASNDDSTKLATTAWVRSFTQPYTLPIASATILGGVKVGTGLAIDAVTGVLSVSNGGVSIKASQTFTATAGQTVFTIVGGYTTGLIDVFLNGIYLSPGQTTATNGTTVTLNDAASAGDIIDVIITSPISNGSVANTDNLPEGLTNLYYTTARARAAISLSTTGVSGAATYNILTGQLNIPNYQGLVPANGVAGQILSKASGTSYDTTWIDNYTSQIKHLVKLGEAMSAGTPVYVPLTQDAGTNMTVMKASNASEGTSSKTMGLIATGGVAGDLVQVITEGLLEGLDTSTATKGDPVWLGPTGTLIFGLTNKPSAPAHLVFIGIVTRSQANNGEVFVKVQNGFELDELHNVALSSAANSEGLFYESATGLWKNKTIATVLGYTPVNASLTTNYIPKATGATTLGNSNIQDSGTLITLGSNTTISSGSLGIGSASLTGYGLRNSKNITGALTSYAYQADGIIQSDVTGSAFIYRSVPNIQAATFTLSNLIHFSAVQGTLGAGATITTQTGFLAQPTLIGALSNHGFRGQIPSGSNRWNIYMDGTANNYLAGSLGIGSTTLTNTVLNVAKNITGAITSSSIQSQGTIQSDVTSSAYYYYSGASTAASSFTVNTIHHYAALQGTFGAGSTVIQQHGFYVNPNLIGATNNYGFRGSIPSGTNRWNIYMDGTANNHLAGNLLIGSTADNGSKLQVTGAATFSSSVTAGGRILTTASGNDTFGFQMYKSGTTTTIAGFYQNTTGDGLIAAYNSSGTQNVQIATNDVSYFNGRNVLVNSTTSAYGSLGIGYSFGVKGTNSQTFISIARANQTLDSQGVIVGLDTNSAYFYVHDNIPFTVYTNGAERLKVLSDGPLQFSTIATVPTYNNSIYSTSANGYMYIQGGTTGLALTGSGNRNNGIYIISTLNAIAFHTNNQGEKVRITDTGFLGINTTNPLAPLHVNGDIRTTGLRLNQGTNNQGHRIYSRTMDVSAYTSQTSMRFTVAGGNSVQFQYEITFHATRLSGNLVEIWYLRYTGGIAYDTAGNPNERWWDLREQAGNGIASVGRNNNTGNLEITNSAFDTSCRLTVCVKITCNNWDAVTVSFS